ncbi:hypothetical protein EYF80_030491 [Liparis tanakae]|uniref:Uncharacterized protein n=1 Tax=Liparis tanakae TaxID=230148 RepID=A0A4Z2H3B4_9TELE|nr:hypothetical protein EYF80_030491 [Liparis tanakae]
MEAREKELTVKYLSRTSEKLDPLTNQPSGTTSVCSHWITRALSSLRDPRLKLRRARRKSERRRKGEPTEEEEDEEDSVWKECTNG